MPQLCLAFSFISSCSAKAVIFFIVGAQKSGTTSMRLNLRQHPEIHLQREESHLFDRTANATAFQNQVERKSKQNSKLKAFGDCTPSYMWQPLAMYRIRSAYPKAKIIISLRNPVWRAYSQYCMGFEKQTLKGVSFNEAIVADIQKIGKFNQANMPVGGFVSRGIYVEQIERTYSLFPKEQIHISCQEQVQQTLKYDDILEFLGVSVMDLNTTMHNTRDMRRDNTSDKSAGTCARPNNETVSALSAFFKPWNEFLLIWVDLNLSGSMHYDISKCVRDWGTVVSYLNA
eukprot:1155512-Pelagomonas_calceolata.AAC.2